MWMPKFLHYTQNHRLDFLPNFSSSHPAFELDGIAEMYWHNEPDMQEDFNRQQSIALLRQDECEFISHISVCIVEETLLQGQRSAVKLMFCLSSAAADITEQSLKQALPNLCGVQRSDVTLMINRPQLPALPHVPQQFFSIWFERYSCVLADFQADRWQQFYQTHFQQIQRVALILVHPFKVR